MSGAPAEPPVGGTGIAGCGRTFRLAGGGRDAGGDGVRGLRRFGPLVAAAVLASGCQSAGATPDRRPSELVRPVPGSSPAGPVVPAPRALIPPAPGPVAQLPSPAPGAPSGPAPVSQAPAAGQIGPDAATSIPVPPPPPAAELLRRGEAAFTAGDVTRAQSLYEELLLRYPADPLGASALVRLGELALARSDFGLAQRQFQDLLLRFPTLPFAPSARYRLAYATYRLGQLDDAIEILKGLLTGNGLDPFQTAQAHLLLAQAQEEVRRPLEAARTYARLLALPPPDDFRTEGERRLAALVTGDRLSPDQLAELAATGPGAAAPLAKLRLAALALENSDGAAAERLAREVLAAPAPPGAPADLLTRAQAALDEALRLVGADAGVVGVVLPLSGQYQAFGERLLHGLMLAAGVFAPPTPGEPPIRLAVRDTGGNPAAAARAVEELVAQERAIAVVGPLLPQPAEEAAKAAQRLGVPLLTLSQRPKLTEAGPFVFRPFTTGPVQGRAIARQAMERQGLSRFAILYPEDAYGTELMQAFRDEVKARGGTVTDAIGYQPGQTDFGKEIRRLAKIKQAPRTRRPRPGEPPPAPQVTIEFDALFVPDYYDRVGLIAPQLAFYDVKGVRLLGGSGWNSPDLIRLGREHVEGALFVDSFWAESPTPKIREFVERFRGRFDDAPTVLEAEAYDALRILLDTLRRARPASREALRAELARVRGFPGLTGPFAFTADREPDRPLLLLTVEGRKIRQVN